MENMKQIENFRTALWKRLAFDIVYFIAIIATTVVAIIIQTDSIEVSYALGFGTGIGAVMIFFLIKYIGALRNDDKLKKLMIEENDERTAFIDSKAGSKAINAVIMLLALAMLIANFFDKTVFFTLLAATLGTALTKMVIGVYYSRKI